MLLKMHNRLSSEVFELAYVQLWILWYRRNLAVHQDRAFPITYWKQRCIIARDDFLRARDSNTTRQVSNSVGDRVWKPPNQLMIKINVDAAQRNDGSSQLGICARNHEGNVFFSSAKRYDVSWHPSIAEALAIQFGLQCAKEENGMQILVESDSHQVISLLQMGSCPRTDLGKVVADILLLSSSFTHVEWSHTRREGNALAHHIAKHVYVETEAHWINSVRVEAAHIVELDRMRLTAAT